MNARTKLHASMLVIGLLAACAGPPAASPSGSEPPPTSTPVPSATERTSLLPDGIWEAELSAGADLEGGIYRWTFDGTRARISKDDEWACEADASPAGDAVRLAWHVAMGCGGHDTMDWSVDSDGLHLTLVDTDGNVANTRAILESAPFQSATGDATLFWSDAWVTCGDPDGGACRRTLDGGTYTTDAFEPGLTYTMPAGWQNLSDIPGEVFFLAPGYSVQGVGPGGSEYVGVYAGVRAENRACATEAEAARDQPGVAHTPEAMAAEFQARPGLATTEPEDVTIGGLSGLVMDISMSPDWTGSCFYRGGPAVQLIGGDPPSEFDHGIIPGLTMRLYLLHHGDSTLGIEIDDYSDGAHLDAYSAIVEQFVFDG